MAKYVSPLKVAFKSGVLVYAAAIVVQAALDLLESYVEVKHASKEIMVKYEQVNNVSEQE